MILLTFIVLQAVLGSVLTTLREDTLEMERQKLGRPGERTEFNEDWEEGSWGFFKWGKRTVQKTGSYGGYRRVSG
jgi:hypothetical protein